MNMEPVICPRCRQPVDITIRDDVPGGSFTVVGGEVVIPPQEKGTFICPNCGATGYFSRKLAGGGGMTITGSAKPVSNADISAGTMPNLEDLDASAQQILSIAQEEARSIGHPWVETEHLLLALLRSQEGAVVQFFSSLNLRYDTMRKVVEAGSGRAEPLPPSVEPMLLDPDTAQAFARATERAHRKGRSKVTASDLIVGLFSGDLRTLAVALIANVMSVSRQELREAVGQFEKLQS